MPRLRDDRLLRELGTRLKRIRTERGFTQEVLAERTGLRPTAVSRAETGDLALSLANLMHLAEALGVRLAELVDLEGPDPPSEISSDEADVLALWRNLPEDRRELARRILREISR